MDDDDRASAECNQMHIEDLNEKIESLTQALDCAVVALGYYAKPLNWQYTTYDNYGTAKPDDMGPVFKYEGDWGGHIARKKLAEIEILRGE